MAGYSHGNRFCRNICVDCKEKVLHRFTDWNERTVAQSDENLFFNVADAPSYLDIHRKLGFESHSIIADPLFVDRPTTTIVSRRTARAEAGLPADRLQPDRPTAEVVPVAEGLFRHSEPTKRPLAAARRRAGSSRVPDCNS